MAKTTEAQMKVSVAMQELAGAINDVLEEIAGTKMGFCLVVFNEEDNGYTNYVANTDRAITMDALKHMIKLWEDGLPNIPTHERQ